MPELIKQRIRRLFIKPQEGNEYTRMDFLEDNNKCMAAISCHEKTNPKPHPKKPGKKVKFLHRHLTIYVRNAIGKMIHALDITHSTDRPQVQVEHDLILKGRDSRLIIRGKDKNYYHLFIDDGVLKVLPIARGEIHWAGDEWVEIDE